MAYRARYSKPSRRQLRRLSGEAEKRVRRRVDELKAAPRGSGSKQLQGRPVRWSSRVGDLRIIYRIYDREQAIFIEAIGNRDNIYELMRRR